MEKKFYGLFLLLSLSVTSVVYGAASLRIINIGNIGAVQNFQFSQVSITIPSCATSSYSETSPQNIDWGTLVIGDNLRYFCLKNAGNVIASISGIPDKGTGIISPSNVASGTTAMITLTWRISATDVSGTANWTVDIS